MSTVLLLNLSHVYTCIETTFYLTTANTESPIGCSSTWPRNPWHEMNPSTDKRANSGKINPFIRTSDPLWRTTKYVGTKNWEWMYTKVVHRVQGLPEFPFCPLFLYFEMFLMRNLNFYTRKMRCFRKPLYVIIIIILHWQVLPSSDGWFCRSETCISVQTTPVRTSRFRFLSVPLRRKLQKQGSKGEIRTERERERRTLSNGGERK